jgi:hypothetical protein
MDMTKARAASAPALLLAALLTWSCNNDPGIEQAGTGGAGDTKPGGAGGATGGSGGRTTGGAGGTTPAAPGSGGAGGAATVPGDKSCSATSATAKPVQIDVFVLLDRSHSMTMSVSGGGRGGGGGVSKWDSMKDGLTKFVQSPAAAGLAIGLGYFPGDGDVCNVPGYAMPAVPVAALPGVATPFLASVNMTMPVGNTPTLPALEGVYQYAKDREAMTGRRLAVALATDGLPNDDCGSSIPTVVTAATAASTTGILTFVIGVGPALQNLDAIATAGGTKMAYQVASATADELATAFRAVQSQASKLACSFTIPPPPVGQTLDPNKVNVRFMAADPTKAFDIGQVSGASACGPMGGWYYDNASKPTTVNLCGASCQQANGSGEGTISLLFGCQSVIIK